MKKELMKYEGKLLWDGKKYVTATTYSACERETLFRTRSGRWILRVISNYFDRFSKPKFIILNKPEVAKWLSINNYEPHPDVKQEYQDLCITQPARPVRQRITLTDGTGRWFDLANALRLNPLFKSDFIVIKDAQKYERSAYLAETYLIDSNDVVIIHLRAINENEASHRWFLDD